MYKRQFLLFLYSILASFVLSFFHFQYFIFLFLTASATSSFHHHVSLCLGGPFVIPHMSCAVSIIIPFICYQWSFTPRPFHFTSSTLYPTKHLNSSHVFSSLSFHTRTLGSNFLRRLFVALNRISNNKCDTFCQNRTGPFCQPRCVGSSLTLVRQIPSVSCPFFSFPFPTPFPSSLYPFLPYRYTTVSYQLACVILHLQLRTGGLCWNSLV